MLENQKPRVALYARDMTGEDEDQLNLIGQERPVELQMLIQTAAQSPRPFDILLVTTMAVLGTPSQAAAVCRELEMLGVTVETEDGTDT